MIGTIAVVILFVHSYPAYCECPSCGAPYYDGYCEECGYPDVNQGWLGEE